MNTPNKHNPTKEEDNNKVLNSTAHLPLAKAVALAILSIFVLLKSFNFPIMSFKIIGDNHYSNLRLNLRPKERCSSAPSRRYPTNPTKYNNEDGSIFVQNTNTTIKWKLEAPHTTIHDKPALSHLNSFAISRYCQRSCNHIRGAKVARYTLEGFIHPRYSAVPFVPLTVPQRNATTLLKLMTGRTILFIWR